MKKKNFYEVLSAGIQKKSLKNSKISEMPFHEAVRKMRIEKNLTGADMSRRAGMDPRTLNALEKGRIKNPSLKTLDAVARGLGILVSDLFRRTEAGKKNQVVLGTPKGFFQMDFPQWGIKVVSFTPWIGDFFCGKFIFGARKKFQETLLPASLPLFLSVLVGRFEIQVEEQKYLLKEGESLFLSGKLRHSFQNMLEKESVLQVVTAPSFLALRQRQG
mgnify:CR=1 FL=1